jgi:hypothetical protein
MAHRDMRHGGERLAKVAVAGKNRHSFFPPRAIRTSHGVSRKMAAFLMTKGARDPNVTFAALHSPLLGGSEIGFAWEA